MAMSPDGQRLYVVNTPDNRLEIFRIAKRRLIPVSSVPVGLEPVAVAVRSAAEVWVVNHLSDSVSIVRDGDGGARTVRTLSVGDEPRDIVFAGPNKDLAFIAAARSRAEGAATSRTGKADIYVFDANDPGAAWDGTPRTIINLFSETPRALAVTPDGLTVYAAAFHSGNGTTVVGPAAVAGDLPEPRTNVDGDAAPSTALIVKDDGTRWLDAAGRDLSSKVRIALPDLDVFAIDAAAPIPRVRRSFAGVGTTLFNMVVNPVTGQLYVSNTDARNIVRFEGPGVFGGSTVRGRIVENRITVIDGQEVQPRHLNTHINYEAFPGTPAENAASLAIPLDMTVSGDGTTLYVAAFGSSKIGVFDTRSLHEGSFAPNPGNHIEVAGGGPSGIVLDEPRNRLYVLTRFDNAVTTVDLASREVLHRAQMHNPEPPSLTAGRRFLYDARYTSSRGDSACASCHIFGDNDALAWDLGNPDARVEANPNPFRLETPGRGIDFHPMKGPMLTQSLRGMANQGPMHWRGDRTGGSEPEGDPLDERAAFMTFNGAFEALLGRTAPLTETEMAAFADFALQLAYPPNPIRALDNSLTEAQAAGRRVFFGESSPANQCISCHVLSPADGFFGTDGMSAVLPRGDSQPLKIPHLRNLYTRAGAANDAVRARGPQVRGYGFTHSGAALSLLGFLSGAFPDLQGGDAARRNLVEFLMAFDSDLAPVVGRQVTVTFGRDHAAALARVDLLAARAAVKAPVPECDLIAKGRLGAERRGWVQLDSGAFGSDRAGEPPITLDELKQIALTASAEVAEPMTFTCAPPGSGVRMGVDRDGDGVYDRDELDTGRDPDDAAG